MANFKDSGYDEIANLKGYTPLFRAVLNSVAGRNLRCSEHAILNRLALKWVGDNNGKIAISKRELMRTLHIGGTTAIKGLKRLEQLGFIRVAKTYDKNPAKRRANEYRLTFHRDDVNNLPASNEWMRVTQGEIDQLDNITRTDKKEYSFSIDELDDISF